jgi:hypothetical protein
MDTYEFTLFVDGDLSDDDTIGALLAAGCDDASFGGTTDWGTADFHRDAHDLAGAITSAIRAIESVGLRVVAVQPAELVTMSTIAERLGCTYESVRLHAAGQRGKGDFPRPADIPNIYGVKLWRWADILSWAKTPDESASRAAALITATNALLELRAVKDQIDEMELKELHVALGI